MLLMAAIVLLLRLVEALSVTQPVMWTTLVMVRMVMRIREMMMMIMMMQNENGRVDDDVDDDDENDDDDDDDDDGQVSCCHESGADQ